MKYVSIKSRSTSALCKRLPKLTRKRPTYAYYLFHLFIFSSGIKTRANEGKMLLSTSSGVSLHVAHGRTIGDLSTRCRIPALRGINSRCWASIQHCIKSLYLKFYYFVLRLLHEELRYSIASNCIINGI